MAGTVKKDLGRALRLLLKPLVKLLVNQGITHGEFSDAAKDVYVEVALRHEAGTDKKMNKSKLAILTGLTRKEVANVINRAIEADVNTREFSRPSRVLSGWHNDPDYTGPYGVPLELPYDNPSAPGEPPSFVHLVKTYSGDMTPKGMLEELLRVGAVVQLSENSMLKVVRREFLPEKLSSSLIDRFGDVGFNFLSTVAANVEKEGDTSLFDRVVFSDNKLTRAELEQFDQYLKENGQRFLEQIDIWFSVNVRDKEKFPANEETFDTGVAMVQYIEWSPDDKKTLHDLLIERRVEPSENDN